MIQIIISKISLLNCYQMQTIKTSNTSCVVVVRNSIQVGRVIKPKKVLRLYGRFYHINICQLIPYFLYLHLLQSMIQSNPNLICFVIDFFKNLLLIKINSIMLQHLNHYCIILDLFCQYN